MGSALRVLLVGYSEDDAELLLRALRGSGFDPRSRRLLTIKAMRAALKDGPWDIILCDYTTPHFSAPAVLDVVKEERFAAPLIVVSEVVRIDDAVEMLKAGAHDFVDKDDLERLVPAVERSLREAETRRGRNDPENALKATVEQLVAAEEAAAVGHWRRNVRAGTVEWSDEAYRIHGFGPGAFAVDLDKMIGFYHPDDRETLRRYLQTATENREAFEFELRLLPPDGLVRHVRMHGECELDKRGRVARVFGVVEEIAGRAREDDAIVEMVHAISLTIEKRDPYTFDHQRRVAELCGAIGGELGLDRARLQGLCFGAMIHDVGKVWIPAEILIGPAS